ncbi:MAG: leucine-rich repeat protein [Firmicutes bacterium]|nr:leucine-rich repeat protein [Bacillota bacterium]
MKVQTLKCSSCGHNLEAEENMQKIFCKYCGTQNLITQDITHIHNTTHNTTHNTHHTQQNIHKTIIGKEQNEAEDHLRIANEFLSLGETGKARQNFQKAIDHNPADYRGWFGFVVIETNNFTDYRGDSHREYLEKAVTVANEQQKAEIYKKYDKEKWKAAQEAEQEKERKVKFYSAIRYARSCYSQSEKYKYDPTFNSLTYSEYRQAIKYFNKAIACAIGHDEFKEIEKLANQEEDFLDKFRTYSGTFSCPQVEKKITDMQAEQRAKNSGHYVIPDGTTEIKDCEFKGKGLTAVTIPKSVKSIGRGAFKDCKNLTSVIFESGSKLTSIFSEAFAYHTRITSIVIPDTVTYIGEKYVTHELCYDVYYEKDRIGGAFAGWEKHQTIYVNKKNSKEFGKKWKKDCKAKIKYYKPHQLEELLLKEKQKAENLKK